MLLLSNHSFLGKFSKGILTKYLSIMSTQYTHVPQPHAHIFVIHSKIFSLYWKHLPCEEDYFPQLKKDPSADHTQTFSHLNTKIISALCCGKSGFHRSTPPIFRSTPLGYLRKACSHRPPLILGPTHSGYHPQGYDPQIGEAPGSRPSPTQKTRYPKKFNLHPKIAFGDTGANSCNELSRPVPDSG